MLPTGNPNAAPGTVMDDFNYDAIAWTLTAHEARPGHELQFAQMLERGVSTARVVFAFNSANVEGWALYAEAVLKKYLPPEGQIGALQMCTWRVNGNSSGEPQRCVSLQVTRANCVTSGSATTPVRRFLSCTRRR